MRPKSLEQLLFEAYVNHRGLRLTADDVDSLVSDDAVATRISNRACQEAGADEVGEDCIANAICAGAKTWDKMVYYFAKEAGVV